MIRLSQTGDTIVEVLMAIMVISAVLGSSFVLANRSLRGSQRSQERAEATKMVESQLEQLKAVASRQPGIFTSTNAFCFDSNGAKQDFAVSVLDIYSNYPVGCNQGVDNRYHLSISRSNNTFTVQSLWDAAGTGRDNVTIVYRLY